MNNSYLTQPYPNNCLQSLVQSVAKLAINYFILVLIAPIHRTVIIIISPKDYNIQLLNDHGQWTVAPMIDF